MIALFDITIALVAFAVAKKDAFIMYKLQRINYDVFYTHDNKPLSRILSYNNKDTYIKIMHKVNAVVALSILIIGATMVYYATASWQRGAMTFAANWALYSLVFDITYAVSVKEKWHYLGQTSWADRLFKNGKIKTIICVIVFVALHVIYFLW